MQLIHSDSWNFRRSTTVDKRTPTAEEIEIALDKAKKRIKAGYMCLEHLRGKAGYDGKKAEGLLLQVRMHGTHKRPIYEASYKSVVDGVETNPRIAIKDQTKPLVVFCDAATAKAGWLTVNYRGVIITYPGTYVTTTLALPPCDRNPADGAFQLVYHDPVSDTVVRELRRAPTEDPTLIAAWNAWEKGIDAILEELILPVWKTDGEGDDGKLSDQPVPSLDDIIKEQKLEKPQTLEKPKKPQPKRRRGRKR